MLDDPMQTRPPMRRMWAVARPRLSCRDQLQGSSCNDSISAANVVAVVPAAFAAPAAVPGLATVGGGSVGVTSGVVVGHITGVAGDALVAVVAVGTTDVVGFVALAGFVVVPGTVVAGTVVAGTVVAGAVVAGAVVAG